MEEKDNNFEKWEKVDDTIRHFIDELHSYREVPIPFIEVYFDLNFGILAWSDKKRVGIGIVTTSDTRRIVIYFFESKDEKSAKVVDERNIPYSEIKTELNNMINILSSDESYSTVKPPKKIIGYV